MENLPVVSDLFKLIDDRFGRFWGSLLLLVAYLAILAALARALWDFVVAPLAAFFPKLITGSWVTTDNLGVVISSVAVIVALTAATAAVIPLINNVSRRRVPQAAIDNLAELRSEGVAVLNDVPKGTDDVARWRQRWTDWKGKVVDELKRNFTKAETLSFDRLGLIAPTKFGFEVTPEHGHCLMMLSKQLTTLENLIERHQERR